MLSNAVGGIRLQVVADDVAHAQAILASPPGTEPANELEAERTEDAGQSRLQTDEPSGPELGESEEPEPQTTDRERNAERAFRGAILGLLFFPLQVYVFWLLLRVYLSDEDLRGRSRSRAWVAAVINAPYVLFVCLLLHVALELRRD